MFKRNSHRMTKCADDRLSQLNEIADRLVNPNVSSLSPVSSMLFPAPTVFNITCPETKCQAVFDYDDFGKHMAVGHFLLKMADIQPKAVHAFQVNVARYTNVENYCVKLFMLRDKDLVTRCHLWRNHIPVVLMCTPLNREDLRPQLLTEMNTQDEVFMMFWMTGKNTNCLPRPPLVVQIVFGHQDKYVHKIVPVYGCELLQIPQNIYDSGCGILFGASEIAGLCKNGLVIDVQLIIDYAAV